MIVLTRLNDTQFAINPDLIERIHVNPDTTLVMVDGAKYIVTESLNEVIALISEFRARIISMARDLPQVQFRPGAGLGLVSDAGSGGTPAEISTTTNTVPLRPRNS